MKTLWHAGVLLLLLSVLLFHPTIADPDLWGHLRFGLDTLELRSVDRADTYSYLTAERRWINHEWLAEVIFALAYSTGGALGLNLLRLALGFGTLAVGYAGLCRHPLILLLALPGIHYGLVTVRPQLFTCLLFAVVLVVLVAAEKGRWKRLWVLPPLFMLWVNLHGGFLAGLAIVFLWSVFHATDWRRIVPVCLLCALATLANPYGVDLLVFLLQTATVPRPDISEWQSLQLFSVAGGVYVLLLAIAMISLARERRPLPLMAVFVVLAVGPWVAVRHLPLFALGVWMLANGSSVEIPPRFAVVMPALIAVVLGVLGFRNLVMIRVDESYPVAAVAALKASGARGKMVVPFDWGQYVIWHLGPQVKVSIDGRRETIYAEEARQADINFRFGGKDWDRALEHPPADMALVTRDSAPDRLMRAKAGWGLIYEDPVAAVFAREGAAQLRTADGKSLNFP